MWNSRPCWENIKLANIICCCSAVTSKTPECQVTWQTVEIRGDLERTTWPAFPPLPFLEMVSSVGFLEYTDIAKMKMKLETNEAWLVNRSMANYFCLGLSNILLILTGQGNSQKMILQASEILDVLEDAESSSQPTSSKFLPGASILCLKLQRKLEYIITKTPSVAFEMFSCYGLYWSILSLFTIDFWLVSQQSKQSNNGNNGMNSLSLCKNKHSSRIFKFHYKPYKKIHHHQLKTPHYLWSRWNKGK